MKKYTFLLKPTLFIFNLVFATWLVFAIERTHPSDFGRYGYVFEETPPRSGNPKLDKKYLKKLCIDYNAGLLDTVELERRLDRFLSPPGQAKK